MTSSLLTQLPLVDALFDQYADRFGKQQSAYRNHVYRLINIVHLHLPLSGDTLDQVQIAGFFHDAGIWLAGTFDYLQPSARLANHYLKEQQLGLWQPVVHAMIMNHHKISAYDNKDSATALVEAFRRADWTDVTLGAMRFGLPGRDIQLIRRTFPNAGFHRLLLKLSGRQLLSQPWRPLPMLRR